MKGWIFIMVLMIAGYWLVKFSEKEKLKNDSLKELEDYEKECERQKRYNYYEQQTVINNNIKAITSEISRISNKLPIKIAAAENALVRAEKEFYERAFTPFWDAIEQAMGHLSEFDSGLKRIVSAAKQFKEESSKLSSGPQLNIALKNLPDSISTVNKLNSIIRDAQKDFQFATIYEQRKTNKLLFWGFANLGEAIDGIAYTIERSVDELNDSMTYAITNNECNTKELYGEVTSLNNNISTGFAEQAKYSKAQVEILKDVKRELNDKK